MTSILSFDSWFAKRLAGQPSTTEQCRSKKDLSYSNDTFANVIEWDRGKGWLERGVSREMKGGLEAPGHAKV